MENSIFDIKTVPRETIERLEIFTQLLLKWNKKINLVADDKDIWQRHVVDSLQLLPLLPATQSMIIDLGSGAGFPGLILAIATTHHIHLIESDKRKCAFLSEAARTTHISITIHNERIENVLLKADLITARACANLQRLLSLSAHQWQPHTIGLFLKGKTFPNEINEALKDWQFTSTLTRSITDPESAIVKVSHLCHAAHQPQPTHLMPE